MSENQAEWLCQGTYRTREGRKAHVWEYGVNGLGEVHWSGRIDGIGPGAWDSAGRDLSGSADRDLVQP